MSTTNINQRDNTRNQSALDITQAHIFMGNNKYQDAVSLVNDSGAEIVAKSGMLVKVNTSVNGGITPFLDGDEVNELVGVLILNGEVTLANAATLANVTYAISGDVNEAKLETADSGVISADEGVSLTTNTFRSLLQKLGFHLIAVTENTKLDN
jgi:hypothetical protein